MTPESGRYSRLSSPTEPVSRLGPSGFDPERINAWRERRYELHRAERRQALADGDEYSAASATGAMLELLELNSFLLAARIEAGTDETPQGERS